jgi:spore coat polysaccharide biosynthesis protein SpsF
VKILIVIQARRGSTRFPNKVMMPLKGKPLLIRMIERVRAASAEFETIVATTAHKSDDSIRQLCREIGVKCYSGHPTDLLDRHYQAAVLEKADVVAKIPSDCPLIDPAVISKVLGYFLSHADQYDFVSNLHPPSYPDGNDVEVMSMSVLDQAWRESERQFEREHTTPFIWEWPERFRVGNVAWETGKDYSQTHRWTIDYPEDYHFISSVYDRLWTREHPIFSIQEILDLLEKEPSLATLNEKYAGENWYRHHLHELRTIRPLREKRKEESNPHPL